MAMTAKNKVKADTVLKDFWRDNARFADLFNAALFQGKMIFAGISIKEIIKRLRMYTRIRNFPLNLAL